MCNLMSLCSEWNIGATLQGLEVIGLSKQAQNDFLETLNLNLTGLVVDGSIKGESDRARQKTFLISADRSTKRLSFLWQAMVDPDDQPICGCYGDCLFTQKIFEATSPPEISAANAADKLIEDASIDIRKASGLNLINAFLSASEDTTDLQDTSGSLQQSLLPTSTVSLSSIDSFYSVKSHISTQDADTDRSSNKEILKPAVPSKFLALFTLNQLSQPVVAGTSLMSEDAFVATNVFSKKHPSFLPKVIKKTGLLVQPKKQGVCQQAHSSNIVLSLKLIGSLTLNLSSDGILILSRLVESIYLSVYIRE